MIDGSHAPRRIERRGTPDAEPRLSVQSLTTMGDLGRPGLAIDALGVRPREIVGIEGVSGKGQREPVA